MAGVGAALWLLGLLAAAPALRTSRRYALPDRLRDGLILGVAIAFVLGFLHLLYPVACWLALALALAVAYRRNLRRAQQHPDDADPEPAPYLLVAALALVAWPQVTRPPLDGDSLSYHLPNAAAWVHAHSLWTTDPRYWWYPPASELFASALCAVSGPLATPWSGFGALALLGFRLAAWARAQSAAPWQADALAAATVTAAPLALQAGSLQNDVWLAAFFLEALATMGAASGAAARTFAVTALIKPYGWIFALLAAGVTKAPRKVWFAAVGAIGLWAIHDALLWHGAVVPPATTSYGDDWGSTIAAHGLPALALLTHVALRASPFALFALIAALAGPVIARAPEARALGWAACGAAAFFVLMPLAYADRIPQLATGASLRYAAPAVALGGLLLIRAARPVPRLVTGLLVLSTAFGAAGVLALFWSDAPTRAALGVAVVSLGLVAYARATRSACPIAAGLTVAIVMSGWLTARLPLEYYTDAERVDGKTTGAYAWIARLQPDAVGGLGLRMGTVNVLAPAARALDLPPTAPCAAARREGALLVAVAESNRSPAFNARRLDDARACGHVRYDDGIAVIVDPGRAP